jgi:DNA-binding GntR family transcriptional regulator
LIAHVTARSRKSGTETLITAEESLRDQAYAAIRDRIVSGAFKAGDPLSDSRLAAEIGVSRTPVRAALEALQADGMVRRHRSGYSVAVITPQTIHDVYFVRVALECHAIRNLDPSDSQSRWDKFEYVFRSFQARADQPIGRNWPIVQEADRLFHREIVLRTGNEVALQIADRVERRISRFRVIASKEIQKHAFGSRDHLQIVEAILEGNPDKAAELLQHHLVSGRDFLVSLMSRPEGSTATAAPGSSNALALWLEGRAEFPALEPPASDPAAERPFANQPSKSNLRKFRQRSGAS